MSHDPCSYVLFLMTSVPTWAFMPIEGSNYVHDDTDLLIAESWNFGNQGFLLGRKIYSQEEAHKWFDIWAENPLTVPGPLLYAVIDHNGQHILTVEQSPQGLKIQCGEKVTYTLLSIENNELFEIMKRVLDHLSPDIRRQLLNPLFLTWKQNGAIGQVNINTKA